MKNFNRVRVRTSNFLWLWFMKFWLSCRLGKAVAQNGTPPEDHRERGDVPGWVMITLMSAALVAGLLALAGPALEGLFNQAISKVGK